LTTVTTVGGLVPILLETSVQAQILIPMATSIAFGQALSTLIVLYLVPVSYSIYWSAGGRLGVESDIRELLVTEPEPELATASGPRLGLDAN
jgi:hypothetical protein